MREHRLVALLGLLRQGLRLDREFGRRSLESLLRIAETVENSVYEHRSLRATDTGFRFALSNPPLRIGAFRSARLSVDGRAIATTDVEFRSDPAAAWRTVDSVDREHPIVFVPGQRTEFRVHEPKTTGRQERLVRLELRNVAIPPLVWFEFRDAVRDPAEGV